MPPGASVFTLRIIVEGIYANARWRNDFGVSRADHQLTPARRLQTPRSLGAYGMESSATDAITDEQLRNPVRYHDFTSNGAGEILFLRDMPYVQQEWAY